MAEIRRSPVEGTVVYPIIHRVSAPSQVVGNEISAINSSIPLLLHLLLIKFSLNMEPISISSGPKKNPRVTPWMWVPMGPMRPLDESPKKHHFHVSHVNPTKKAAINNFFPRKLTAGSPKRRWMGRCFSLPNWVLEKNLWNRQFKPWTPLWG